MTTDDRFNDSREADGTVTHPEPIGVEARRAALRLLDAVLRKGLPLDSSVAVATQHLTLAVDRAFARAIAAEALRRLPDLDALIDSATARPLPPDAKARSVLRIALIQALAMGTPPHAAIATTLPLVEGGPRRLVHGVFGALTRGGARLPETPTLPEPVARRWGAAWGAEAIAAAGRSLATAPPVDLTLADPAATGGWAARLGGESFFPGHVRIARGDNVTALAGFDEGGWWVQDIAASLPARLLGAGDGRSALDLCAAPGGKTMQLAAAGWQVTAVELAESRLARLSDNLSRTSLAAKIVTGDILSWSPSAPADAVLLDAPCSATGIFRRHPDVLHRVTDRAIATLALQQQAMIARAAAWVAPGGALVYAVCSLEPAEGEAVADRFLAAHPAFAIRPVGADELPAGIVPDGHCRVRVAPGALAGKGGADGFFIARFQRL